MAIIKCPDCGKEASNKAKVCIHCGFPIEDEFGTVKVLLDLKDFGLVIMDSSRNRCNGPDNLTIRCDTNSWNIGLVNLPDPPLYRFFEVEKNMFSYDGTIKMHVYYNGSKMGQFYLSKNDKEVLVKISNKYIEDSYDIFIDPDDGKRYVEGGPAYLKQIVTRLS